MNSASLGAGGEAEASPEPLHNAALLSVASLAAKGCGFVALLVATRMLGKSGMGEYGAILSFVAIAAVVTDPGLTTLAVRDVARDQALLPRYLSNVLALRIILSLAVALACMALAVAFAPALHYPTAVLIGIAIWALALVPVAVVGAVNIAFQARERMAVPSAVTAGTAALTAVLGSAALLLGGRVVTLIVVMAAVNLAAAVATLALARRVTPLRVQIEPGWWPALLRLALPFATLTLLNVLYSRADNLLVFSIKGPGDAGLYSVTYRFVDSLLTLVIAPFNAAMLPAFNRIAAGSAEALRRLVVSGTRIMLALGVPVAVAATIYPRTILLIFGKPEYLAAAPALQWLAWSFPCFTVLAILYNALYAAQRAAAMAAIFGLTLVFNVALNLALIPHYAYFASAALTTASEALNLALAWWVVRRSVGPLELAPTALRVAAAGAAMALVMAALQPFGVIGVLVGLPAGAATYLVALRLLHTFGAPEQAILARVPLAGRWLPWAVGSRE